MRLFAAEVIPHFANAAPARQAEPLAHTR
jgi:hypothetical protein